MQTHRQHRGRRRLSVGPGHREAVLQAHQLAEHLRARDHRDLLPICSDNLNVVIPDCCGANHDMHAVDVARQMADEDVPTEAAQALHYRGLLHIGARDLISKVQQQLGDAGHSAAADANKMDA